MIDPEALKVLIVSGLLGEANRQIFHPVGYYFGVKDGDITLVDCLDNPERCVFPPDKLEEIIKKRDAWMKQIGNNRMRLRQKRLGFIVQGPTDGG